MRSIFLEKSYTKCGEEASPRPFFLKKKSKLSISPNQQSEILYSLQYFYAQVEVYQIYLKKSAYHLLLTYTKPLLKSRKRGLDLVSLHHFLYDF